MPKEFEGTNKIDLSSRSDVVNGEKVVVGSKRFIFWRKFGANSPMSAELTAIPRERVRNCQSMFEIECN
jgi:hypothetical protein